MWLNIQNTKLRQTKQNKHEKHEPGCFKELDRATQPCEPLPSNLP